MPRKRREQKLCEEFEAEGIYTIEKLLELVSKLSKLEKTSDCLDWDLKEWLYENSEAFPPEEFQKLLDLENHCTPEQYKVFRSVTNNWHFSAISSSISDKHIQLVAENPDAFSYAYDDIFPEDLSLATKIQILKEQRECLQQRAESESGSFQSSKQRDNSPVRH